MQRLCSGKELAEMDGETEGPNAERREEGGRAMPLKDTCAPIPETWESCLEFSPVWDF